MEKIAIDDVEPGSYGGDFERRGLSDPLNTSDVAINHYRLGPGERLAGLHAHVDQEEVFVVLDGEATFETFIPGNDRGNEATVAAGEAIRFAPGEFQSCKNDSDGEVVALALGAPRQSEDVRIPLACPDCGHDDLRLDFSGGGGALVCPDCGNAPETACPECGHDNKRAVLGDDGTPVDCCPDCGATFESLESG